jgi:hypothetical protein
MLKSFEEEKMSVDSLSVISNESTALSDCKISRKGLTPYNHKYKKRSNMMIQEVEDEQSSSMTDSKDDEYSDDQENFTSILN